MSSIGEIHAALERLPSPTIAGLDIDGTITAQPRYFAALAKCIRSSGGKVHVVSSRSPSSEVQTRLELTEFGIAFDALYLLPGFGSPISQCPHAELNWFDRYLWQKVGYAQSNRLNCFFDDDHRVITLFGRYAPAILLNSQYHPH